MRNFSSLLLALSLAALWSWPLQAQTRKPIIAITQIVEHPDLDNVRKGVLEALAQAGYDDESADILFESAQGDIPTAVQIANHFVNKSPDIIIGISTPSAQAVVRATRTIPVVFGAIGDPLGAGLVTNMEHPGQNVTGTRSFTPVEPVLDLIHELMPNAKSIGILSNPGEANSRAAVNAMVAAGTQRGYEVIDQNVMASSEIATATIGLVGRTDVVYIPTDNTVTAGAETAIKIANDNKIPVFSAESAGAKHGALLSIGFDWYEIGRATADIAVRILKGEKPGDIPVESAKKVALRINLATAKKLGVTVPKATVDKAVEVYD